MAISGGGSNSGGGASSSKGGSSKGGSSSSVPALEHEVSPENDEEAMARSEAILGVHPVRFVDDVYNFTTQYVKRSVDSLEGTLADDEETRGDALMVRNGCAGCQARLIESFDKNIDKFELYVVRNCMRVPAHIDEASAAVIACAGSASAQDGTVATAEQEATLDTEMTALRRKIQAAMFVNKSLKHKLTAYDEVLESWGALSATFVQADALASARGVVDFGEAALKVMEIGSEMATLEKQYAALNQWQSLEYAEPVAYLPSEQTLASCRGNIGFPSTRELGALGKALGV